eukprot:COSAG01_NODE_57306_length_313_cov_0.644860_1_plen_24_part_10
MDSATYDPVVGTSCTFENHLCIAT